MKELRSSAAAGNICCAVLLGLKLANNTDSEMGLIYLDIEGGAMSVVIRERRWSMCFFTSGEEPPSTLDIPYIPPGSHLPSDTASAESVAWAKAHLDICVATHQCSKLRSATRSLPTRLIEIENTPEAEGVVLRNTNGLPSEVEYTALSHCWGSERPKCITTSKNYDRQCERIAWVDIPRTFREAIQFTKKLGLHYIWIDSICIKQPDDEANVQVTEDWLHESVQMADYYSRAYVTLAATSSVDCNGGLFSKRPYRKQYLLDATIGGKHCQLFGLRSSDDFVRYDVEMTSPESHPLMFRGWAFQERLVSCRVLHFTKDQLIFDCGLNQIAQQAPPQPLYRRAESLKQRYWQLLTNTGGRLNMHDWMGVVKEYSKLKLTKPSDRLPAIAAIAQQVLSRGRFDDKKGNTYLCGLMKHSLYSDLSWFVIEKEVDSKKDDRRFAPSWSWASYPGKIYHNTPYCGRPEVQLVNDSLQFTASGRFGACTGGHITIRAPVLHCIWKVGMEESGCLEYCQDLLHGPHPSPEQRDMGSYIRVCSFTPDFYNGYPGLEELKHGDEVEVEFILLSSEEIRTLVLYQNTKTKHYRRLSASLVGDEGSHAETISSWFTKAERETFNLE